MRWAELEAAAPELAGRGRERLESAHVALLGTIRADGAPRISPVEPYLAEGELLFGSMTWSRKTSDLRRDARCLLHSAVTSPDAAEGELKVRGRAGEAEDDLRDRVPGWWRERPRDDAVVFRLEIESAVFVAWDLAAGRMTVRSWSPRDGARERSRSYP